METIFSHVCQDNPKHSITLRRDRYGRYRVCFNHHWICNLTSLIPKREYEIALDIYHKAINFYEGRSRIFPMYQYGEYREIVYVA